MAKHLIPFRFTPASWGLVGDAYRVAEAYYELEAYALERRLLELRVNDNDSLNHALLDLDERYERISAYDAARQRIELAHPVGVDYDLAMLEVEHRFSKITTIEYQKRCASIKNEPWIAIVDSGFDPEQGIEGVFFEFDWNQQWIDYLRANGCVGHSDEQVVDDWFSLVCRSYNVNDAPAPFSISPS